MRCDGRVVVGMVCNQEMRVSTNLISLRSKCTALWILPVRNLTLDEFNK